MPQFLRSKTFRVVAIVVLAVFLYGLAGFVLAPRLLRSALIENAQKALGVTPSVGAIRINPFLLQLEVNNFSLPSAGGEKLMGFERLYVNVGMASLWRRALFFKDIEINAPYVNAVVDAQGVINLLQLKPKPAQKPVPAEQGTQPLPRIQIGMFRLNKGVASYEDRSREPRFATRLEPIEFDLRDFTTGGAGGLFDFDATTKRGERIEWHGHVAVQPVESDGDIKISGLKARTIWEYIEEQVGFVISSGSIDLAAHYRFSLRDGPDLKIDVKNAAAADLGIRPKDSDADWIFVPALALRDASLDLSHRDVHVDSVVFTGLKLLTWLEPDKSVNLLKLAGPAAAKAGAAPTAPAAAPTAAAGADRAWRVSLREFQLKDANISAEDRGTKPAAAFALAPLSLEVMGASMDLSQPLKIKLDTGVNGTGRLTLDGEVTPAPLAAELGLQLTKVELKALQPYIEQMTAMTLLDGRLTADLKLHYGKAKPTLSAAGNIGVESLHTIDDALRADFINWQQLDLVNFKYQQDPDRLEIERVAARRPYARVIIESDTSLNVTRVLAGPRSGQAAPAPPVSSATAPAKTTPAARKPGVAKGALTKTPPAPAAQAPAKTMFMAIRKVEVADGEADFSDLSVQPNFSAGIKKLNGAVSGLSSKPESRATVDLHGEVDAFSPVSITGDVNLLSPALYTDLAMSFRNMELSLFNPYSGKFAGYAIRKGKLTTELHYKVEGRKLDATHHITLDQLEFGEKTESKDAVSLPVKLAVALLKDRNGVIDLNIPVSGSLDDPQFRIGPLIFKVLVNLLEKIITAPFALLGSLFSAGPDLQFVDFQPGAAALDAPGADKIKTIAKALAERPQLKLEVPIAPLPEVDRPALTEARFAARLQEQQAQLPGPQKNKAAQAAPFGQLDPAAQLALLQALYEKTLGTAPKYPEAIAAVKPKADADVAKRDFLVKELKGRITVADEELRALAEQRAQALQQALLTGTQLDPERIFLVANDKAKAHDGLVRLELALQ